MTDVAKAERSTEVANALRALARAKREWDVWSPTQNPQIKPGWWFEFEQARFSWEVYHDLLKMTDFDALADLIEKAEPA